MADDKKTTSTPKKAAAKKSAPKSAPEKSKTEEIKAEAADKAQEGAQKAQETAQKAYEATSDAAKVAYDATRDAAMSAYKAFTVVITDPMGGQGKAMQSLGEKGSLAAGIFYVAIFVVLSYLFSMFGGFGNHLKLVGLWLVIPVAMCASFWALGLLHQQKITWPMAVFSTGVTLFPVAAATLLTGIDIFAGWIDGIIMVYAVSILVLLVGGYLLNVLKTSTQRAVLLAPTVLVVVFVVAYLYLRIVYAGPIEKLMNMPGMGAM